MGWLGPPHGVATCACHCLVGCHEWLLDVAANAANAANAASDAANNAKANSEANAD